MEISFRCENSSIMDIITVDHFLCCLKVTKKSTNFCHKTKRLFLARDRLIYFGNPHLSWKYNHIGIPCRWVVHDNLQLQ